MLVGTYRYLDLTPLGRQEGMEMVINGFTWHDKYKDAQLC